MPHDEELTPTQKARIKGKEQGGIIVLLDGDKLHHLWCGWSDFGQGADLMIAHVESVDGEHHVMGRVRIQRDEHMWASADKKQCIHFATNNPNGDSVERIGDGFLAAFSQAAGLMYGFKPENIHTFRGDPEKGAVEEFARLLETEVPDRIPGWRTSSLQGVPIEEVKKAVDELREERGT